VIGANSLVGSNQLSSVNLHRIVDFDVCRRGFLAAVDSNRSVSRLR
jgi:hypothetical protein